MTSCPIVAAACPRTMDLAAEQAGSDQVLVLVRVQDEGVQENRAQGERVPGSESSRCLTARRTSRLETPR